MFTNLTCAAITIHPALFALAVFAASLAILLAVVFCFKYFSVRIKEKKDAKQLLDKQKQNEAVKILPNVSENNENALAPGRSGEMVLVNVSERDAALIMAIVANEIDAPLNELDFKLIKKLEGNK